MKWKGFITHPFSQVLQNRGFQRALWKLYIYLQDSSLVSMHWKSPKISRKWKESRPFYIPQSKDYTANLNVWKGETTLTSQMDIQRALQMRKMWLLWPSSQKVRLSFSFGTVQRILYKELYLYPISWQMNRTIWPTHQFWCQICKPRFQSRKRILPFSSTTQGLC